MSEETTEPVIRPKKSEEPKEEKSSRKTDTAESIVAELQDIAARVALLKGNGKRLAAARSAISTVILNVKNA